MVATVDPFGYYAEGIQQRLDDAFVEGETSSQAADPHTPSAEELPPSVLAPSNTSTVPGDTAPKLENGSAEVSVCMGFVIPQNALWWAISIEDPVIFTSLSQLSDRPSIALHYKLRFMGSHRRLGDNIRCSYASLLALRCIAHAKKPCRTVYPLPCVLDVAAAHYLCFSSMA